MRPIGKPQRDGSWRSDPSALVSLTNQAIGSRDILLELSIAEFAITRVRPCVITDHMPIFNHAPKERRLSLRVLTEDEEGRSEAPASQHVQEASG